jgi:hypothetical protein
MDKEFVTYEQALTLKELGFDEECFAYYYNKELSFGARVAYGEVIESPLKQQVFRWFREKYKLVYEIQFGDGKIWIRYGYNSYVRALELDTNNNEFFHTYEEAENACIDKLIELAKQQDNEN